MASKVCSLLAIALPLLSIAPCACSAAVGDEQVPAIHGAPSTSQAAERSATQAAAEQPSVRLDLVAATRTGPSLDVRDFGATGDDESDDTAAIQSAIDDAEHAPGSVVYFPAGTYHVSERTPWDQIALRVQGAHDLALVGEATHATHIVLDSERDAHLLWLSGCESVSIENLSFDGQRSRHKLGHGIRIASAERVVLRNLVLEHMAHYGIGLQQGVLRHILIDHVAIDDTGADAIDFANTDERNEQLWLRNITISRPSQVVPKQAGVDLRGSAELSNISVSQVPAGATGIRFRHDALGSTLSDFVISGGAGSAGVVIDAHRIRVERGFVANTDTGVHILANDAIVKDTIVSEPLRYGFRVASAASNAAIIDCSSDRGEAGVWIEGDSAAIQGCVFSRSSRCGACIRATAEHTQLATTHFEDNARSIEDRGLLTVLDDDIGSKEARAREPRMPDGACQR